MRRLLRIIRGMIYLGFGVAGVALLVATAVSFWRMPAAEVGADVWPDDETQLHYRLDAQVYRGRLRVGYLQDRLNGKFGPGWPEVAGSAGFIDPRLPHRNAFPTGDWFAYAADFSGQPNSDQPLSVSASRLSVVLPAPLVGLLLLVPPLLVLTRLIREMWQTKLRSNTCLHCGHLLIDVDSDECPQCGAVRPLVTVSSVGSRG